MAKKAAVKKEKEAKVKKPRLIVEAFALASSRDVALAQQAFDRLSPIDQKTLEKQPEIVKALDVVRKRRAAEK